VLDVPRARQTQPKNEEGLAGDRAEGANLLAPGGETAVGRSTTLDNSLKLYLICQKREQLLYQHLKYLEYF